MIIPPVNIHPTAKIVNSIIGPHTTVAADCHIEHSIIRNTIIDSGAEVVHSLLDQSLIGRDASVGGRYRILNVGDESFIGFT
jgi:glucose-1-phosphate thymidylyltransferase